MGLAHFQDTSLSVFSTSLLALLLLFSKSYLPKLGLAQQTQMQNSPRHAMYVRGMKA